MITRYTSRSGKGDCAADIVTHSRKMVPVTDISLCLSSVALGKDKRRKASPVCIPRPLAVTVKMVVVVVVVAG